MSSLSIPEHDTFQKSRRALIITSVVLFIIVNLDIQSKTMNVFGLTIPVEKQQIIIYWRYIVIYFLIVTGTKMISYYIQEMLEINLETLLLEDKQKEYLNTLTNNFLKPRHITQRIVSEISRKLYLIIIDIFLPLVVAVYAIGLSLGLSP